MAKNQRTMGRKNMRRAMILAAGRGQRMGKLTEFLPKPLLYVQGRFLIEYAISNLKQAGIEEIIINVSYRAEQIKASLGDGSRYDVKIIYSEEKERLETGGGIFQALPLLGSHPFIVMSSDIITDYALSQLPQELDGLAHLVLVNNPVYHLQGDYELANKRISLGSPKLTFANIGVYHPDLFANCKPGHFRLTHVLNPAIEKELVTGEHYQGKWHNVGAPDDLKVV